MAAYNVRYVGKKNGKPGNWWVVITPEDRIANNFYHPTEASAIRHSENLNAFFGGERENNA